MDSTPKKEMLHRLVAIAQNLESAGDSEVAGELKTTIRALKLTIPAGASMQEVVTRTLSAVIKNEVSLDGRLVSTLSHVAKEVGVHLTHNPALLISAALALGTNPDRYGSNGKINAEKSAAVDVMASVILGECTNAPYATVVDYARYVAEVAELKESAAELRELVAEIEQADAASKADTMAAQAEQIEANAQQKPPDDDEYGWVVKTMLTLLALIVTAGVILDAIDDPVGTARRIWDERT